MPLCDRAVQSLREEAEVAAGAAEIDDIQHLRGGAAESQGVDVCRCNVGVAVHRHALVIIRAGRGGTQGRDLGGGVTLAQLIQQCSDAAGMIRLDR